MKNGFGERRGEIRSRLSRRPVALQASQKARVRLQFHFPGQRGDEIFERLTASRVGQDGILVLLTVRHVYDGNFVRLSAFLYETHTTHVTLKRSTIKKNN